VSTPSTRGNGGGDIRDLLIRSTLVSTVPRSAASGSSTCWRTSVRRGGARSRAAVTVRRAWPTGWPDARAHRSNP